MILCCGELLVDSICTPHGQVCHIGGAPFNVAVNAARHGAEVRFVGNVGDDEMGRFLLQTAPQYGMDLRLGVDARHPTTIALVTLDEQGERSFRFLRTDAADYQLDVAALDWDGVSLLHLGTLMLNTDQGRAFFAAALAEARKRGVRVSVDANFRDDLFDSIEQRNAIMAPFLLGADVLKLGHDELASLTDCEDVERAAALLGYDGLLFVTMGAKGSAAYRHGRLLAYCPSTPVENVVDTTGAGDAFFGTVLACLDQAPKGSLPDMTKTLALANEAGALATQTEGAV